MRSSLFAILWMFCHAVVAWGSPTVGVYYYPWWGENVGGHSFDETMRDRLTPNKQLPAVGSYNNRNASVIAAHIDQSHIGNISMWSMSWWGPGGFEDVTIRQHILQHPRAAELQYTIHYESPGRLGNSSNPNFSNLATDFDYLAEHIWSDPNYMRIDGRPVMIMYLTRDYFRTEASWDALANAREAIEQEYGYDPYIIGDDFFGSTPVNAERAAQFDAITDFDVYGTAFGNGSSTQNRVNTLNTIYANAKAAANEIGVSFVPTVSPGFNDTGVRTGHTPAARYLSDLGPTAQGSLMTAIMEDAVLPNTDPSIEELIMVNSFNEWHEDTQIEASVIAPLTNTDNSPSGSAYTFGRYYEGYGNLYLDLLRQATVLPGDYDSDGNVDADDFAAWKRNYGSAGPNLRADGNRNGVVDAADYIVWKQAVSAASASLGSALVPEPMTGSLVMSAGWLLALWRGKRMRA